VLCDAGFQSSDRTSWVVEGLIPYLTDRDAQDLLVTVGELSSPGTALALDQPTIPEDSLLAQARAMKAMETITSMWRGGMRETQWRGFATVAGKPSFSRASRWRSGTVDCSLRSSVVTL
jgi:O-methyltransferase involved in polyketide biosynthesis